jgi:uncharacterized membrane protein YeiH
MDITFKVLLESLGIMSFAITGMIVAKNRGVSHFGIFLVALVAGLGGGTVRDVLLDLRPFYWEKYQFYIPLILILSLAYSYWPNAHEFLSRPKSIARAVIEAVAVASLGITGANKALEQEQAFLMIAVYGVVSAAFGGVLRDVVVDEFPLMFKPGVFLAEALFIGSLSFAALEQVGLAPDPAAIIGGLIIFGMRMIIVARERRRAETISQPIAAPQSKT